MTHHFPDTRHAVSQCSYVEWIVSTGLDLDVSGEGGKRHATLKIQASIRNAYA